MTDFTVRIKRSNTGSALLDQLHAEHTLRRAEYFPSKQKPRAEETAPAPASPPPAPPLPAPAFPPLPQCRVKSVEERVADAEKFRGELSNHVVNNIIDDIHGSARDLKEKWASEAIPPPQCPPEIATKGKPTIAEIQRIVSNHFNITVRDITSERRLAVIVLPRQIAMYLSRIFGPEKHHSFDEIGRRFGGRDHTTVRHSVQKITALVEADKALADEIAVLKEMLLA